MTRRRRTLPIHNNRIVVASDNTQNKNTTSKEIIQGRALNARLLYMYRKRYPWAKDWTLENFQNFEKRAQPVSVNGKLRTPITYKPKTATVSTGKNLTPKEREQRQKVVDNQIKKNKELKEIQQASEIVNNPYNPIGWIPGVRTLYNVGADQQYSRYTGNVYTPYTINAALSAVTDALTLGFGIGPWKNYAGAYAGTVIGGLIGEQFDSPHLGQFIGGTIGGFSPQIWKYGRQNLGTKNSRLAATMDQNISLENYTPQTTESNHNLFNLGKSRSSSNTNYFDDGVTDKGNIYLLENKSTQDYPTKSLVFDPRILDDDGYMTIDWDGDIFHSITNPGNALSYSNKYYNPTTKTWSSSLWPDLLQEFKIGKGEALSFFDSNTYKAALQRNKDLYNRLTGKILTNSSEQSVDRASQPISGKNIKVTYNTNDIEAAGLAQSAGDVDSAKGDILQINTAYPDLDSHIFHEFLHRGNFGKPIRPSTLPLDYYNNTYKPEQSFFRWKEKKLLDPEYLKNNPDPYLVGDGEGFTNMLQLGKGLGLEYGQPYPGAQQTLDLLQRAKEDNILGKGFVVDALNLKKPKRLWQALTGQYSWVPWAIGGTTAVSTQLTNDNTQ